MRRELREEFELERVDVGPWIWTRRHVWSWRGIVYDTHERFALVRLDDPARAQATEHDSFFTGPDAQQQTRWWTLGELEATADKLSPRRLPLFLRELLEHGPPAAPVDVGV